MKYIMIDSKVKVVASDRENAEVDSNIGDESDFGEGCFQEAYDNIYSQWLRICNENHSLVSDKNVFLDFENKADKKVQVSFKEEKISDISSELERTQKNIKMLNFDSVNLEQILFNGKTIGDHKGLGFKGEYSNSKTGFVKFDLASVRPVGKRKICQENKVKSIVIEQKPATYFYKFEMVSLLQQHDKRYVCCEIY